MITETTVLQIAVLVLFECFPVLMAYGWKRIHGESFWKGLLLANICFVAAMLAFLLSVKLVFGL